MTEGKKTLRPKPERRAVSVISVPDARPDDGLFNPFKEAKAAEAQITAVPQYRSTAVPEPELDDKPEQSQIIVPQNTGVPEYRSTVVPERNYYKKANEVADAIDRTLTPAESKVFEQLLRLTVGFQRDTRQVRVSVLMERTGFKSDKTVRQALRGLELKGRILRITHGNSPLGDEYQILAYSGTAVLPEYYRSTGVENTGVLESKVTGELKTDLKDKDRSDDEAAGRALREMEREVTGKNSATVEQWAELVEVLKAELRIAAARTTVSSVPAFMAEHLRRRLWKLDKKQALAEGRELPDQVAASTPRESAPVECPDCKGSGWWYPEGTEKGVAKCKHERAGG
jgi:DNA-binding HxlR family transcriptional regulator